MHLDWRTALLETIPYLRGQSFLRKSYKASRPDWDHDHCAVCGMTFAEPALGLTDALHEGFAVTADYSHGEDYEWVCAECFGAVKEAMSWTEVD